MTHSAGTRVGRELQNATHRNKLNASVKTTIPLCLEIVIAHSLKLLRIEPNFDSSSVDIFANA